MRRIPHVPRALPAGVLALAALAAPGTSSGQATWIDTPVPPAVCRTDDDRVEVLLLGSYHMSNPGLDRFNLAADDVLAPRRQAELRALVERLARFRPTTVAVEAPWGDTLVPARYEAYRRGALELRRSEEEQIGFRLARLAGLAAVRPIDVRMNLDDGPLGPVVAAHPEYQRLMHVLEQRGGAAMERMAQWLAEGTVGEMLHHMNRPDMILKAHEPYVEVFVPVADADAYPGADMVATWYRRNLRIFANITRITTSPDDRIFVVYGAGHIPILRDLVEDHPDYCIEDPLPYLTAP